MTDTHEGGCACGAVRNRVQRQPVLGTVCHFDRHIWVRSKLPWVVIPEGVASYAQGFVAAPT